MLSRSAHLAECTVLFYTLQLGLSRINLEILRAIIVYEVGVILGVAGGSDDLVPYGMRQPFEESSVVIELEIVVYLNV